MTLGIEFSGYTHLRVRAIMVALIHINLRILIHHEGHEETKVGLCAFPAVALLEIFPSRYHALRGKFIYIDAPPRKHEVHEEPKVKPSCPSCLRGEVFSNLTN
jgi:hypothetical protein